MNQLPLDQILHGDCIEIMRQLPAQSIDCIFADPPYNLQLRQELYRPNRTKVNAVNDEWDQFDSFEAYDAFTQQWLTEARRLLKDTGTLWVIGTYHNIFRIGKIMQDLGFWILNDVVWIKCLSETTYLYVKTNYGERPMQIKDLVRLKPENVQLWNGEKWVRVLGWQPSFHPEGCLEITLRSGERIRCSPNHVWFTQRGCVEARDLVIGDVLETCRLPEPDPVVSADGLCDEKVGWFVGLYLAEGSRSEDTIIISSHTKEIQRFQFLKDFAQMYHGTAVIHQTSENGCSVHLNGKILNAILDTYVQGNTARTKHLTPKCWQRSNRFLKALLEGYLSGDGHWDHSNQRWRLGLTRNPRLENDLRTLAARLGISIRLHPYNLKQHEKTFPILRGQLRFFHSDHPNAKPDSEVIGIGRSWAKKLWDIAVEDPSHRFALASGVLSHNSNPMPNFRGVRFTNAHETLIWAQKEQGKPYTFNYHDMKALNDDLQMRSDWYLPLCTGRERLRVNGEKAHSTQKPEALLYRVILASTKPGDVILDPFFGTGTTGAVAKRLGRHWIGIERDARYVEIARRRIEAVAPVPKQYLGAARPRARRSLPFGALVECGYLAPGDALHFRANPMQVAHVLANGHIRYQDGTEGSIHAVARYLTGAPCNGWEVWYYRDAETGTLVPIDSLRKRILTALTHATPHHAE